MVAILADALKSGGLGTLHHLPDELIEEIVDDTFTEARAKYYVAGGANHNAGGEGASSIGGEQKDDEKEQLEEVEEDVITFDMYEKMVYENNDIIKWLAIDLQRVTQTAKLILSDKAAIKNI